MHHHPPHCKCPKCVYPTKVNQVNTYSESCVEHVHPSHTNVVNHHTIKNYHTYPHSTSYQNLVNSVDIQGPAYEVPAPPAPAGPGFGPGAAPGAAGPGFGPGAAPMNPGFGAQPWRKR
ncbi:CotD family spore coat protein [Oceanobacillus salinisoli]|uniref:CotD family spore coat protein n=1 Tax=Oceanobacillus salinisoli TaxID=2678611 RepID=UPI0012E2197A|nr:CotD family spore coat protein [Oceanobacillus salinisoli]